MSKRKLVLHAPEIVASVGRMSLADKILLACAITAASLSVLVGLCNMPAQKTIVVRQPHPPYPQVGDVHVEWHPAYEAEKDTLGFTWPRRPAGVSISRVVRVTNGVAFEVSGFYNTEMLTNMDGGYMFGPATNWMRSDRRDVLINRP